MRVSEVTEVMEVTEGYGSFRGFRGFRFYSCGETSFAQFQKFRPQFTSTKSEKLVTTANERYWLTGICSVCGTKKEIGLNVLSNVEATKCVKKVLPNIKWPRMPKND
ncbi:hypothetical protein C1645_839060 [Glomus cerebriforme]|uniref:Uncharacterized protein n=1 Tax=Glomus cerebriforme TaxID=658196 RepID=A0A397S2N6_9GLOM|nr:hypothetical protein C1645_839060 [Glomus cerebriforme]